MHRSAENRHFFSGDSRRAFTMVESLVVVLIFAILTAVAVPFYQGATDDSARRVARANLYSLLTAQHAYRLRHPQRRYAPIMELLLGDGGLKRAPQGPGETNYRFFLAGQKALDGRVTPRQSVAVCAQDASRGKNGNYGCLVAGVD